MDIKFEQGTLVFYTPSDFRWQNDILENLKLKFNFLWDPRINKFRAPANKLKSIQSFLEQKKIHHQYLSNYNVIKNDEASQNWHSIELRDYQFEAYEQWIKKEKRGVVILPTGAGKTRLSIYCISSISVPTLILVPTRVLLHQWAEVLQNYYKGKIGLLGDSQKNIEAITVSTFESAKHWMPKIGNQFNFLIVDEAHHFLGQRGREILDMSPTSYLLGLTATFTDDPIQLKESEDYLGPVVYKLNLDDLRGKVLSDFEHLTLTVSLNATERMDYDYNIQIYKSHLNQFTKKIDANLNKKEIFQLLMRSSKGKRALGALHQSRSIVARCQNKIFALNYLIQRFSKKKIIIFTADTEMAIRIAKILLIMPITSKTSQEERKKIISNFICGNLGAIVTCRVLNEGFDVPNSDMAIILGGSHGSREHIQRIGRILRPVEGKVALVYEVICKDTFEVQQSKHRNVF
jgi:superfamily II DNA or RNA helicase